MIKEDGSIEKGAQNLPGNWESSKFNLPASLVEAIPQIGDHDTAVLMHNDGVAQGSREVPFMQDVERWGVLTIGTGLGNARFTNRKKDNGKDKKEKEKDKDKDDKDNDKKDEEEQGLSRLSNPRPSRSHRFRGEQRVWGDGAAVSPQRLTARRSAPRAR